MWQMSHTLKGNRTALLQTLLWRCGSHALVEVRNMGTAC